MVAWVIVVDTPYFARSTAGGRARLDAVPAGAYQLRVWHSSLPESTAPTSVPLTIGADDVEQRVRLVGAGPVK